MVVVSDPSLLKELMDVRGASTANRPQSHALDVVTGGLYFVVGNAGKYAIRYLRPLCDSCT